METRYITTGLVQPFGLGEAFVDYPPITQPAAGALKAVSVEGQWWVRVLHARATITTDGNAGNRLVTLDYINARTGTMVRNGAGLVVTASTTNQVFEWDFRRGVAEWAANTPVFAPLSPVFLEPGFTIQFSVDNIQVGDQLASLSLVLEKFPTGPRGMTAAERAAPLEDGY